MNPWEDRGVIAYTAAAIFAGAAFVTILEAAIPGGQELSAVSGTIALVFAVAVAVVGPRLPRLVLMQLGPIGVVLIGYALATTRDYGDGAVLYMWPVLWMACFYGTAGTVAIVAWVAFVHAGSLLALPPGMSTLDRWIDVVVAVAVVATVVRFLVARIGSLVLDLREEARVDALTGLLNRRGFDERFEIEVARALRDGTPLAAVQLDLDRFKDVNDTWGHEFGDRVLAWVGALMREHARRGDLVARFGGEEFVVVLPAADAADAARFAERIRALVESGVDGGRFGVPEAVRVTVSAGVAVTPSVDLHDLLDQADHALYAAKRAGRNRVETATSQGEPAGAVSRSEPVSRPEP